MQANRSDTTRDRVLLDVHDLAALLGCSPRHVQRLAETGQMPAPVKLGALSRWSKAEIDAWIVAGCPPVPHQHDGAKRSGGAK